MGTIREYKPLQLFLHEIKTPLATIIGYLDLLTRDDISLKIGKAEILATLKRNAWRLHRLLDLLHQWLAIQAGESRKLPDKSEDLLLLLKQEVSCFFPSLEESLPSLLQHPQRERAIFLLRFLQSLSPESWDRAEIRVKDQEIIITLCGKPLQTHLHLLKEIVESVGARSDSFNRDEVKILLPPR